MASESFECEEDMTVDVETLQKALEIVFEHLKQKNVMAIAIEDDFYWNIPSADAYDPIKMPTDLDLGQLSDDWARIRSIAQDESIAVGYSLVWAASILRRIGELHVD
jgi:hypothetical protein